MSVGFLFLHSLAAVSRHVMTTTACTLVQIVKEIFVCINVYSSKMLSARAFKAGK